MRKTGFLVFIGVLGLLGLFGWSIYSDRAATIAAEPTALQSGRIATDFTITLFSGETFNLAERRGSSDYSDVDWWLEIQADIGTTATNCTITYTNAAGTPAQTLVQSIGSTTNSANRAGRMFPLLPSDGIRSVETVQLTATTGTAGNFAVVATRRILSKSLGLANSGIVYDWSMTGLPRVPADTCLFPVIICGTTTTGTLIGTLRVAAG